jgi:hypothetical protein
MINFGHYNPPYDNATQGMGVDGPNDSVLLETFHGDNGLIETSCLSPCTLGDIVVNLITVSTHLGQDSISADIMEKHVDSLLEWLSVESRCRC